MYQVHSLGAGEWSTLPHFPNRRNSTKFVVTDTTGNTIAGTLDVTSATALNGGLTMDSNKFVVTDTTGNTAIAGTLSVMGVTTVTCCPE